MKPGTRALLVHEQLLSYTSKVDRVSTSDAGDTTLYFFGPMGGTGPMSYVKIAADVMGQLTVCHKSTITSRFFGRDIFPEDLEHAVELASTKRWDELMREVCY